MDNTIILTTPDELKSIIESSVKKIMLELREPPLEVDEWLNSKEVCKMLHISKSTLVNYRKRNVISSHKLQGRLLFKHEEILAKIKELRPCRSVLL